MRTGFVLALATFLVIHEDSREMIHVLTVKNPDRSLIDTVREQLRHELGQLTMNAAIIRAV